jgi:serine phosphatase RsbU (regulator of sigma subunit)/ligand-binding sensor domain-containing protein
MILTRSLHITVLKRSFLLIIVFALMAVSAISQVKNLGIPYFKNYTVEDYNAHKQNWMATQDHRGVIYFGNSMGVLEYDGHDWNIIPLTDKARVVRALFTDKKGLVYIGSDREFGYLKPDSIGKMKYVSLVDKIKDEKDRNFIGVNRIFGIGDKIYFTGNDYIFELYNGEIKTHNIKDLGQTAIIDDDIFIRISKKGLLKFENEKIVKIPNGEKYKNTSLRAALPYGDNTLIVTMEDGLLLYNGKDIQPFKTPIDDFLKRYKIISATLLSDGNYAFGLLSKGLVIISKDGEVIQHIDTRLGLHSDLILNIFQAKDGNLWLCTGNGLCHLMYSLPLSNYDKNFSLNAASYSTLLHKNKLYIASAVGLYEREWDGSEDHLNTVETFRRIGDPVNVLHLDTINGNMLVGTTRGISEIRDGKMRKLNMEPIAVWKFLRTDNPNLAVFGTNEGLKLIEFKEDKKKKWRKNNSKSEGKWVFKKDLPGFKEKCRHVVKDSKGNFWVTHSSKGILKLKPTENFDSITPVSYNQTKGINNPYNCHIFWLKNKVILSTDNGFYYYNEKEDKFIEHEEFNLLLGKDVIILIMVEDNLGNIWYKQQRKEGFSDKDVFEMGELILQDNGSYLNYKTPFYKFKNNIYSINPLTNGNVIIGTINGFIHYDSKIDRDYSMPYSALIRKVELVSNDSLLFDGAFIDSTGNVGLNQTEAQTYQIPWELNDLRFTFSAPFFDAPDQIVYKFFLEGNDDDWTDWKTKNFKEYSNLDIGNYTFRVKAKNIYEIESQEAVYHFTILPPWYRTTWAYIGLAILIVLLIWGIVRLSVRRLRKQKEYLEKVVKERTAEIRTKNTELEQQKEEIEAQRDEIEVQRDKIEEKNKNITASITYAKRIQEAMLPLKDKIEQSFDDYFILFKPRDIVSGDFYWFAQKNNKSIFTAVDCTGHGVPGAFMSMIGSEILTTIVNQGITIPAEILDYKNRYVRKALKQGQTDNQDGMDMSLCTIDKLNKSIEWAGAKNPLIYIKNKELFHIKGDMQSIGGHQMVKKKDKKFSNHTISYADATTYFYIFTDGFQDQFGGPKNRKFMVKRMKELIYDNHQKPMHEQHEILNTAIEEWKKNVEQTDDILVIGFKLVP